MRTTPLFSVVFLTICLFGQQTVANSADSVGDGVSLPEYTLHNVSRFAPIEEHIRVRRSLYASYGARMTCEPGWTGLYCENPICHDRSPFSPSPLSGQVYIDQVYLRSGCDGAVNFPLEEGADQLIISVSTNVGNPQVILTDRNNRVVKADWTQTPGQFSLSLYAKPSAGAYSVSVDIGGVPTDFCHVEIEVKSPLTMRAGFISNPFTDRILEESANAGQPMYLALHMFNLSAPGNPAAIKIRDVTRLEYKYSQLLTRRYQCEFEYYAGFFTCEEDKEYLLTIDGTDNSGSMFRRTTKFSCTGESVKPTLPGPTSPPPMKCFNNGTMINGGTPSAQCFCSEFFTGNQCDQYVCMNGGTLKGPIECECAVGFSGPNCQHVNCVKDNNNNFKTDDKTLILVVRNTQSMAPYIPKIAAVVKNLDLQFQDKGIELYKNFQLATFANDGVKTQTFASFQQLFTAINSLQLVASPSNCSDSITKGIKALFEESFIFNKSPVYVFSDVVTNDEDDYYEIVTQNTNKKFPIHFFVLQGGKCNNDPMSPGARTIDAVARHSGGLVYTPTAANFPLVAQTAITATGYQASHLLVNDYRTCQFAKKSYNTFLVDTSVKNVFVLATGKNLTLTIDGPDGVSTNNYVAVVADGNNYIWEIGSPAIGEYFLKLSSDQDHLPCSFRVIAQSNYNLFFGISAGLLGNNDFGDPIYKFENHLVAQFNGLKGQVDDPFRLFAEISISTTDDEGVAVPLYSSSGVYRDGCSFELYFGSFFCNKREELLYITVYADDPSGATIQRTAVGICAAFNLQPPSASDCLNGGVVNPLNNSLCICTPNFSGAHCENIVCSNNGTASHGYCDCPPGVEGRFCEFLTCTNTAAGINFDYNDRSLAFVLSTRATMQKTLNEIADKVGDMVRNLQAGSPTFIKRYILITVNQTDFEEVRTTSDPEGFVDVVKYVAKNSIKNQVNPETDCAVQYEDGISLAMKKSLPQSFVFVFTDSDSLNTDFLSYTDTLTTVIEQRTSLFLVAPEQVCTLNGTNGPLSDKYDALIGLSGGDLFYTNAPEKILDFIPSLHNSGLAGVFDELSDCTGGQTVYIPVDGWSQSLTLFAHGDQPNVTAVLLPDGTSVEEHRNDYINPITVTSRTSVIELVIPCDAEWSDTKGRYCFSWDPVTNYDWKSASDRCHKLGGSLVDIFSATKESDIDAGAGNMDAWIGLHRVGGAWKWDAPSNVIAQTLGPDSYNNWAANEPSDNTSGKDCVMLKQDPTTKTPKWFTADCSTKILSICQKHRYGQKIMPSDPTTNTLPAGLWAVTLSTASGSCRLRARVQSNIQVFYEFTADGVHSDHGAAYGNIKSSSNRFIATAMGLDLLNPDHNADGVDGRLNYAFMYKGDKMITPVTFQSRLQCAYKSVSQSFPCPDYSYTGPTETVFNQYPVKFSGIDQFGNLFERWSTATCTIRQAYCSNGGFENNGICVCPPRFVGKECEVPVCLNNGQVSGTKCTCPAEFTGQSCEFPICEEQSAADFNNDQRTLAIVLETTYKTTPSLILLRRKLKSVIDGLKSGPTANWFSNYILYPFNSLSDQKMWYQPTVATTSDELLKNLKAIPLYQCPGDQVCETGDKCARPILSAINATLQHPQFISPNSVVLVITRSMAEDGVLYEQFEPIIRQSRAQINVIVPDVASPCNKGFDLSGSRALFRVAQATGGNVFLMTSGEMLNSFLPAYLPSLYKSSTLNSAYGDGDCQSQEFFFQIDSGSNEFTVDFYASSPSITIYSPDGQQMPTQPSLITSGNSYLGVYKVKGAGIYRILLQSAGTQCALNIRSRSSVEIYAGFTQADDAFDGATQDDSHYAPVQGIGKKNVALFHADGLGGPGSVLYYAQIVSFKRGLEFTTPLRKRQNCTYQYVTSRSFDCPQSIFYLVVYGMDGHGRQFERMFLTHCVDRRAPALPAPPTCNLAETKTDFVFVVDSSNANDKSAFQLMQKLIANTMAGYHVSDGNTQVAAMTVSDVSRPSFAYSDAASGNVGDLVNKSMVYDGNSGQALNGALNYFLNTVASNNRPGVRHQIVYITSNTKFTSGDPVSTMQSLKRSGTSGIITIGYKIAASDTFLELLAGRRCTFTASTESALLTYAQNFIQSNSCRLRAMCGEG